MCHTEKTPGAKALRWEMHDAPQGPRRPERTPAGGPEPAREAVELDRAAEGRALRTMFFSQEPWEAAGVCPMGWKRCFR